MTKYFSICYVIKADSGRWKTQAVIENTRYYSRCLATDACLFKLLMSRKDKRRLMLPTPDLRPLGSSLVIRLVFGRGFNLVGVIAPALSVKSERNESRSDANLRRALSKSTSLSPLGALSWKALIVMLLRLLSVPFRSHDGANDEMDRRASSESCDSRW